MVDRPEFGGHLGSCGDGRPRPSKPSAARQLACGRSNPRFGMPICAGHFVVLTHRAGATGSTQPGQQPTESTSQSGAQSGTQFGTITPYLGLAIDQIELPGVPPEEAAALLAATPLKIGDPLTRDALHDAMQALFATGRFSDIQADADRSETAGVRLRFLTVANYFVGMVLDRRRLPESVSEPTGQRHALATRRTLFAGETGARPRPASNECWKKMDSTSRK